MGTGDSGKIVRASANGKVDTFATLTEQEVTALRVGPDGALYAGRLARRQGLSHRERQGGSLLRHQGPVRLGAGVRRPDALRRHRPAGRDPSGQGRRATGNASTRRRMRTCASLFVDEQGRVWAGTSGSGLVLRIEPTDGSPPCTIRASPRSPPSRRTPRTRLGRGRERRTCPSSGGEPISVPVGDGDREIPGAQAAAGRRKTRTGANPKSPSPSRHPSGRGSRLVARRVLLRSRPFRRRGAPTHGLDRQRGSRFRSRRGTERHAESWPRRGQGKLYAVLRTARPWFAPSTRSRSRSSPATTSDRTPRRPFIGDAREVPSGNTSRPSRTPAAPAASARSAGKGSRRLGGHGRVRLPVRRVGRPRTRPGATGRRGRRARGRPTSMLPRGVPPVEAADGFRRHPRGRGSAAPKPLTAIATPLR